MSHRYRPPSKCASCRNRLLRYDRPVHGGLAPHKGRGLCQRCYSRELRAGTLGDWPPLLPGVMSKRLEVVAHVEYLRDELDLPPEKWAADLGTTTTALARRLYRAGRADLASPLERINKQNRSTRKAA